MSTAASLGQTLFGLIAVLGLIGLLAWMARRVSPSLGGRGALLKSVAALSLGPRERVVLVEVEGRWLVLGVTAQQISTLHAMAKPEEIPAGEADAAPGNPPAGGFAALLAGVRSRMHGGNGEKS